MKEHSQVIRLTFTALFAALIMLSTMISIPIGSGYINPGDAMIYASAWFIGPLAGVAGAIGSSLADIILGYGHYAPATFIIKGIMGIVVGFMLKKFGKIFPMKVLSLSVGGLIMASGYFAYELFVLQIGNAAFAGILWNLVQAVGGVVIGILVIGALSKIKGIDGFINKLKGE